MGAAPTRGRGIGSVVCRGRGLFRGTPLFITWQLGREYTVREPKSWQHFCQFSVYLYKRCRSAYPASVSSTDRDHDFSTYMGIQAFRFRAPRSHTHRPLILLSEAVNPLCEAHRSQPRTIFRPSMGMIFGHLWHGGMSVLQRLHAMLTPNACLADI